MGPCSFLFWPPAASIASHSGSGCWAGGCAASAWAIHPWRAWRPAGCALGRERLQVDGQVRGGVGLPRSRARALTRGLRPGVASGMFAGAGRGRRAGCGRAVRGPQWAADNRSASSTMLRVAHGLLPSSNVVATTLTRAASAVSTPNRSVLSLRRAACSASAAC